MPPTSAAPQPEPRTEVAATAAEAERPVEAPRALPPATEQRGPTGWIYRDQDIPVRAAEGAGVALEGEVCGLRFVLTDPPTLSRCTATTLRERLECMTREHLFESEDDLDDDDEEGRALVRGQRAARLVARDARREVRLDASPVWSLECLDGVAVVTYGPWEFTSHRAFAAIDTREGAIVRAREVSIEDALEHESECGNAWDGVELVPLVTPAGLAGAIVVGASASPRFALGVGEIGMSGVIEGWERVAGYRALEHMLEGIPRGNARAAECPIEVSDPDGSTNVRPLANTGRPPVGQLPNGTRIEPVEQRGRWYRIERPLAGWVFSRHLTRRCDGEE